MEFVIEHATGKEERIAFQPETVLNAGYAGRDQEAVKAHIKELEELGVAPPATVPVMFPVANHLLSPTRGLQLLDTESSAEVEYAMIQHDGELYLTVGSDHSDRALEVHSVLKAKNACPNVVAERLWRWRDVADHVDRLELVCDVTRDGETVPYQRGSIGELLPPDYWLEWLGERGIGRDRELALLSGTIAGIDGLKHGDAYRLVLRDPVLGREIVHEYACNVISVD